MDPRGRDQGRELREELVGGEDEEERAAPRPLHPVDEPAVLAAGEPVEGEGRPDRVTAEPLEPVPVVLVDPDAGGKA
jgi:hypothetical protein